MEYKIIPMEARHVFEIAEMERLCFPDPWSENSVASELDNPLSLWLVAEADGKVVGYIGSQSAAGESDIMNLAVLPEGRRFGVAMALISALEDSLKKAGNTALMLEVRDSNEPAITLYEKMGFVCVGVRPKYYFHPREDARIMRKELI